MGRTKKEPMRNGLTVGVIGLGRAGEKHALGYHRMPFVSLGAVCDTDQVRLHVLGERLGAKTYSDYLSLLSDPEIEAVSIVLPDDMHREAALAAVRSGKHILLEKPIASRLEDGRAICAAAVGYEKVFMVGHTLRFDPRHTIARSCIAAGEIGQIVHVSCRRNSTIAGAEAYHGHHTDSEIHLMIHDIDYINWIVGSRPVKVFAKSRQLLLKKWGMKDTVIALIQYEDGVLACVEGCWILPSNSPTELDDRMEIVGTLGALYLSSCDEGVHIVAKDKVHFPDSIHWPEINGEVGGTIYEELTSFVNCIIRETKPLVGASEALLALEVVDAIERSLLEDREVSV
jgi:predicted dehydrogenase